ncbi:transcription antitermination factor NusB [Ammoniphilus oxalaticus]|uniref:Transcription antitermination protein NusB n=1 Tax=Ammoniphilus oxalaticus TaxID=66863 RepID=A0A419SMZ8_9BACL|nr:transcription antitermination factor NusB [Ammoniphilus oxalaticus]RKD25581.1 transcription antitermination factor NusB [Ammoniphilus oxalaticus]
MSRREAREKAVQVLYQLDLTEVEVEAAMQTVLEEDTTFQEIAFLEQLVMGVRSHQAKLDQAIQRYLRDWTFERLAPVDRAVLRIAAYEILYLADEIPGKVSLNEALELTRSFGMEQSVKYINGVLANLVEGIKVGDE